MASEERLAAPDGIRAVVPGHTRFNSNTRSTSRASTSISVQCGTTNLGRYPIDVKADYLELLQGPERIVAGRDDALAVDLRLLPLPTGLKPERTDTFRSRAKQ